MAVIDPMAQQSLTTNNVPVVTRRPQEDYQPKPAVISIEDIITIVGLVTFSGNKNKFKVVWPYAKYSDNLEGRRTGSLSHL